MRIALTSYVIRRGGRVETDVTPCSMEVVPSRIETFEDEDSSQSCLPPGQYGSSMPGSIQYPQRQTPVIQVREAAVDRGRLRHGRYRAVVADARRPQSSTVKPETIRASELQFKKIGIAYAERLNEDCTYRWIHRPQGLLPSRTT